MTIFRPQGILKQYSSLTVAIQRVLDPLIAVSLLYFICQHYQYTWSQKDLYLGNFLFLLVLSVFGSFDLYRSWRSAKFYQEARSLIFAWLSIMALLLGFFFLFYQPALLNRQIFMMWGLVVPLVLVCERAFLRLTLRSMRRHGINIRSAVIVGAGDLGERFFHKISSSTGAGLDFQGFFDDGSSSKTAQRGKPILGRLSDVTDYVLKKEIDFVYITLPFQDEAKIRNLVEDLGNTKAQVFLVPDFFVFQLLSTRVHDFDGFPVIGVFDVPLQGVDGYLKRVLDIVAATLILICLLPLLLIIGLGVKLTSKGPVLFKQKRYGLHGEEILVYKFRTMTVMENGQDFVQAAKCDPRITPFGSFLRKTSLDELPQFWNVLQGRMSIVGPRPHATLHNEQYRNLVKGYMLRHKVKPGITGWAQVNGWRGETNTLDKMEKRVEYDLDYIRNWSLWLDIKIIFLTVLRGFTSPQAY